MVAYSIGGVSSPVGMGLRHGGLELYALAMSLAAGVLAYVANNHLITKGCRP